MAAGAAPDSRAQEASEVAKYEIDKGWTTIYPIKMQVSSR